MNEINEQQLDTQKFGEIGNIDRYFSQLKPIIQYTLKYSGKCNYKSCKGVLEYETTYGPFL